MDASVVRGASMNVISPVGCCDSVRSCVLCSNLHSLAHSTMRWGRAGERALLAAGGRGGRGNASFKTSRNNAPAMAEHGAVGTELWLDLELKLVADVGIIGVPNAGKSTLLSVVGACCPPARCRRWSMLRRSPAVKQPLRPSRRCDVTPSVPAPNMSVVSAAQTWQRCRILHQAQVQLKRHDDSRVAVSVRAD